MNAPNNAYTILALRSSPQSHFIPMATIKEAYRKALLAAHPDKHPGSIARPKKSYSIGAITEAYRILSTPELRAQLDKKLQIPSANISLTEADFHMAKRHAEVIDLDDMHYDCDSQTWSYECRCGIDKAFEVSYDDLEEDGATVGQTSELLVACLGCTSWLRISYMIAGE